MKLNFFKSVVAAAPLAIIAGAANAGGFIAPVVEPTIAPVLETAAPADWAGGYAGATLGYAFSGEDRFGLANGEDFRGNVGTLDLSGANAGLRVGNRWQRDNWVFGPELAYDAGKIEDTVNGTVDGVAHEGTSEITGVLSLTAKVGYAVSPDVLIFGKSGVARADVDYSLDGVNQDYSKTGYIVGLGVEKRINDRWSVTGEYEYANFGKEDRVFGDTTTEATAKYNNIKVGLNFRF